MTDSASPEIDARAQTDRLAASRAPYLIGVRHHSPALAHAMVPLLDRLAPERVCVELPSDLQEWLPHLAAEDLEPPIALAAASDDDLAFYPFAAFSPELVAIRWAARNGVACEAIDLPLASRPRSAPHRSRGPSAFDEVVERAGGFEELWDRWVEAPAIGSESEALRRAALAIGWALRAAADEVSVLDRHREAYMRACLGAGEGTVAVVGAFHAAALVGPPDPVDASELVSLSPPVVSLIAYEDALLDSRSGYAAGIRDPAWQLGWLHALNSSDPAEAARTLTARLLTQVARSVRVEGHVAGVPDAREAVRMALDLAGLRGLAAPARRELLESAQSAMARGALLGSGRALARALQHTMVGDGRGRVGASAPRSGLMPHVEAALDQLGLPGAHTSAGPVELRLDAERSWLDRRREVALWRLRACGVRYATPRDSSAAGGIDTLTRRWRAQWTPATSATLALAATRGVTLAQAAAGALRARFVDDTTLAQRIAWATEAAECGLPELTGRWLVELNEALIAGGTLPELLATHALLERIRAGQVPGLPTESGVGLEAFRWPQALRSEALLEAAVAGLEAWVGSEHEEDARALGALVARYEARDRASLGAGRLCAVLDRMAREGSPLMQGAAGALRALLGREAPVAVGTRWGSWVDAGSDAEGRRRLRARLRGALMVASPLFEADPSFSHGLQERIEALADAAFLSRLPTLRDGFDVLDDASRERLLESLGERHGWGRLDVRLRDDPSELVRAATADAAGHAAVAQRVPALTSHLLGATLAYDVPVGALPIERRPDAPDHRIDLADRWRLILGQQRRRLGVHALPIADALDELYGRRRREAGESDGSGGGQESAFPTVREWAQELDALFGPEVRQEILAKAALGGRRAALHELDAESVTPSIELLEQVLSLKGGVPETQLARLRRLVERIAATLVDELARRVRPALTGLTTSRPTSRPGGALHLDATLRANLRTAREEEGRIRIVPERLLFRTRTRRSLDWRIVLVVDVSGSMEPSVLYSAMMAAILHAAPWVDVRFLTFATEVIDLSDHVEDPLGLLLEVKVGGGTHIARALRHARSLVEVPARTLVITVSDFEEGWPVESLLDEVRALAQSGVTCLGVATLDDAGEPRYCHAIAEQVVAAGMPVATLTPLQLARWIGDHTR